MKAFWKTAPAGIKWLIATIFLLTAYAALAPSRRQRAIDAFTRAPESVMEKLISAGAINTYRPDKQPPLMKVVLVWDADPKGVAEWMNFHEDQIEGCEVWELPFHCEKHLPAIDAVHIMHSEPAKSSNFKGRYMQMANPFSYTTRTAKLPSAGERREATKRAKQLTKQFAATGVPAPRQVAAYVQIKGEDKLFVVENGAQISELRSLFKLY